MKLLKVLARAAAIKHLDQSWESPSHTARVAIGRGSQLFIIWASLAGIYKIKISYGFL